MAKRPRSMHMYDFMRTALDGTRTLCGRHTHGLGWTSNRRLVTCRQCRQQLKKGGA